MLLSVEIRFLVFFYADINIQATFFCWTHVFSLHVVSSGFYYFRFCKCNTLGNKYGALAPIAVYIIMWYWLKFSSHEGRLGLTFQNIYLFKPVKKTRKNLYLFFFSALNLFRVSFNLDEIFFHHRAARASISYNFSGYYKYFCKHFMDW